MSQARHIFKLTSIYGLGNLIQGLLMFLLLPILTKTLSADDYGIYSLLFAMRSLLVVIALVGIHSSYFMCYYATTAYDKKKLYNSSLTIVCLTSFVILLLCTLLAPHISTFIGEGCSTRFILLTAATVIGEAIQQQFLSFLRVKDQAVLFGGIQVAKLFGVLVLTALFVKYLNFGLEGALWGAMIPSIVILLGLFAYNYKEIHFSLDRDTSQRLVRLGAPLMLTVILAWGINMADRFLINLFLSSHKQVGIYNVAATFGRIPYFIVVAPFSVAWATIMFTVAKGEHAETRYGKYLTFFLAVVLLMCTGLVLFSKSLLVLLAGEEYLPGIRLIPMFLLGAALSGLYSFWTFGPALKERSKDYVFPAVFSVICTVLGNGLLLNQIGVIGAAFTYFIANLVMSVSMYYICQKWYKVEYEWPKIIILLIGYAVAWIANSLWIDELELITRLTIQSVLLLTYGYISWRLTLKNISILLPVIPNAQGT